MDYRRGGSLRVAIVGSRLWPFEHEIKNAVASLEQTDVLVSGGCHGADTIAENFAKKRGLDCIIHPADWDTHGKSAGYIRNKLIVRDADRVIAFQLENSKGTQNTIDLARKKGIPVRVISYTEAEGLQVNE